MGQALNPANYEVTTNLPSQEPIPQLSEEHAKELVDYYEVSETKESLINKQKTQQTILNLEHCLNRRSMVLPESNSLQNERNLYLNMCIGSLTRKLFSGRGIKCFDDLDQTFLENQTIEERKNMLHRMTFCYESEDRKAEWIEKYNSFYAKLSQPGSLKKVLPNVVQLLKSRFASRDTEIETNELQTSRGENVSQVMFNLTHPFLETHWDSMRECILNHDGNTESCQAEYLSFILHSSALLNRNAIFECMKKRNSSLPIEEMPYSTFHKCAMEMWHYHLDSLILIPNSEGGLHFEKSFENVKLDIKWKGSSN